jgi:hypothetical protein
LRAATLGCYIKSHLASRSGFLDKKALCNIPERLKPEQREFLGRKLAALRLRYPKLLMNEAIAASLISPPKDPDDCLFAKMSVNFSADLQSRVEPCVFGGTPDCFQCGCAITGGLHWIRTLKVAGPLKIDHFIEGSIRVGLMMNRIRARSIRLPRWDDKEHKPCSKTKLVQIQS